MGQMSIPEGNFNVKSNQIKAFISGSEAHKTHTEHTHTHNNGLQTTNLQTNKQLSTHTHTKKVIP